jgi:hypothetical protein
MSSVVTAWLVRVVKERKIVGLIQVQVKFILPVVTHRHCASILQN